VRRQGTNRAERLRLAVDALPARTKEAMIRGLDSNRIVVGAYVDKNSGGICPMLAAHRNGGRTSLASFARAWDRYTDARRPRLATRREIRALRAVLEGSLAALDTDDTASAAQLAQRIRRDRRAMESESFASTPPTDRHRARQLRARPRWAWLRPSRRYDDYRDLLAAAEEQLSEQWAAELLGERTSAHA